MGGGREGGREEKGVSELEWWRQGGEEEGGSNQEGGTRDRHEKKSNITKSSY